MKQDTTMEVLRRFNEVFLSHDPSALAELIAEDCVIEGTRPAPDGERFVGRAACIARWTEVATAPGTHFVSEDIIAMGDRGILLWHFHAGADKATSVRGVNLMRVRDGRIVEALGYVKGT